MQITVSALCSGTAVDLPGGKTSGIKKMPLQGPVAIGKRGLENDQQVDRVRHGFPAMALHHFPHDHYAWLRHHFGALPRLDARGSMGENISTDGLSEHDVHIGDRFRLGSALVEVTQPRQPCATIERHLETGGIVKAIVATGRSGWFYRVLEPGMAKAGDMLERVENGHTGWSVARAFMATYSSARAHDEELDELAGLDRVSDRMVLDIEKRLAR